MRLVSNIQTSVLLVFLTVGLVRATGQVTPATRGGGNQVNAFGMFTINQPDYGHSFTYGGTFGADYRFGTLRLGQPAIAARISFVPGGVVGENSYLFGPEWHMRGEHLRPYADFHIGWATISYGKGTEEVSLFHISSRSGRAYEVGGGLDYRLQRNFGIRIVDLQYQNWNVGKGTVIRPPRPIFRGPVTYTPYQISTGLYYRFK